MSATAVARDLRGLGLYQESLDVARRVVAEFETAGGRENIRWLDACEGFATALRKAGHHWDSLQESEHVLQRCRDYLGDDHMYTLRAAADLINGRRAVGDLAGAEELARQTYDLCRESGAPNVLLYTVLVNLASVLRIGGRPDRALAHDDQARRGSPGSTATGTRSRWRRTSTTPPTSPRAAGWAKRSSWAGRTLEKCRTVTRRRSPGHADGGGQPVL